MRKTLFVAVALMSVALAGCADDPPSGSFSKTGNALMLQGGVASATYTAEERPAGEQSGGVIDECFPEGTGAPATGYECTPASSEVSFHFMTMPDPAGLTYSIDLYHSESALRMDVGDLPAPDESGMVNFDWSTDSDVSETYDSYQLMLGDHLVGMGPLDGDMSLNPALLEGTFDATYSGKTLTITASGFSTDFTYEGWLVDIDEETGVATHVVSFSMAGDGETTFTADGNIANHDAFHVHVTGTKLNVATALIQ